MIVMFVPRPDPPYTIDHANLHTVVVTADRCFHHPHHVLRCGEGAGWNVVKHNVKPHQTIRTADSAVVSHSVAKELG